VRSQGGIGLSPITRGRVRAERQRARARRDARRALSRFCLSAEEVLPLSALTAICRWPEKHRDRSIARDNCRGALVRLRDRDPIERSMCSERWSSLREGESRLSLLLVSVFLSFGGKEERFSGLLDTFVFQLYRSLSLFLSLSLGPRELMRTRLFTWHAPSSGRPLIPIALIAVLYGSGPRVEDIYFIILSRAYSAALYISLPFRGRFSRERDKSVPPVRLYPPRRYLSIE